jgi:hypothetical protein
MNSIINQLAKSMNHFHTTTTTIQKSKQIICVSCASPCPLFEKFIYETYDRIYMCMKCEYQLNYNLLCAEVNRNRNTSFNYKKILFDISFKRKMIMTSYYYNLQVESRNKEGNLIIIDIPVKTFTIKFNNNPEIILFDKDDVIENCLNIKQKPKLALSSPSSSSSILYHRLPI